MHTPTGSAMNRLILALLAGAIACLLPLRAAWALLPIQHWTLDNGARVYFVENRALPMVDVSVDFPAGYARDTRATSGTANLAIGLMRMGAGGQSENEISARLADVGAQMSTRFDPDRGGYQLRTLSSAAEREQGVAVLARVLLEPVFPEPALTREKNRLVAGLGESDTKPETTAERAFAAALFRDHPYGLRAAGEVDSVQRVTRDDLVAFHQRWFRSDWAVVAIMGDLSRAEADALARRLTATLPRAGGAAPELPAVAPLPAAVEKRIAHSASQSHILLGQPGMSRDDPDYFPLFVGNYVLGGGGFASRLVDEVRQKRGLAYSSYSFFAPYAQQGAFQVGLQTRKDQAEQALAVVRETLARYVQDGPSDRELEAARSNLVGGFPLRIDSNKKIHDYLGTIGFYNLPLDYLDRFVPAIEAVTAEQVRDAFRRRLDPARMVTVVVGPEPPKP
jgi:zinc protease